MSTAAPVPVPDPTSAVPRPVTTPSHEIDPVATAAAVAASVVSAGGVTSPSESVLQPIITPLVTVSAPGATASPPTKSSKSKKKKTQVTVTMATAATAQTSGVGAQGENTGRWTAEEHRLFLQGLEQHGKGWKKIASLIKSRTVVQIRTHAQKYFQKLSKARQNGDEGEISMEGRGGPVVVPSASTSAAQSSKRRRQTSGTKRKAIQSVVSSAQRQGKRIAASQAASGVPNPTAPLPSVAPALSPYVLPILQHSQTDANGAQHPIPAGMMSGPALEDSLFRFLTPAPVAPAEPQVNDVARQTGAHPISVPVDHYSASTGGEVSPTGVSDLSMYPSWTDAKDTPSWYAKGSDVDALLDVADTLDWLTDTGDIHESYEPTLEDAPIIPDISSDKIISGLIHAPSVNNMSMNTLPRVDSGDEIVVPPLPSLFDGAPESVEPSRKLSEHHLASSASTSTIDEHLQVFENPLEEHDFVSSMLENTGESSVSLHELQ